MGVLSPIISLANDHLAGLGDRPTHDTDVSDVVGGLGNFSSTTISAVAVAFIVVGVVLFVFSLLKLRKKDQAGEAILGMVVASFLCIAMSAFGLFVGITHWFAGGSS